MKRHTFRARTGASERFDLRQAQQSRRCRPTPTALPCRPTGLCGVVEPVPVRPGKLIGAVVRANGAFWHGAPKQTRMYGFL
jgi:hypothetical protein